MRIGVHQPNYFPYYPFFQKVQNCDLFVIMGHCQFEKNNYQNRFQYNDKWHTLSVRKGSLTEYIIDKEYVDSVKDWNKIKTNLKGFKLDQFDYCIKESLFETNYGIIQHACDLLGIETKLTTDFKTGYTGTQRLIEICKNYGAREYLSGISGKHYLDLEAFKRNGIKVVFQNELDMIKRPLIEMI